MSSVKTTPKRVDATRKWIVDRKALLEDSDNDTENIIYTFVSFIISCGDYESMRLLLDAGVKVHTLPNELLADDSNMDSLLHVGIQHEFNVPIVALLLDRGADPNLRNALSKTPLITCCHCAASSADCVEKGDDAAEIIRLLFKYGAKKPAMDELSGLMARFVGLSRDRTPLFAPFEELLRQCAPVPVSVLNQTLGFAILNANAWSQHIVAKRFARVLLAAGADANATYDFIGKKQSILHYALSKAIYTVIPVLLTYGADPNELSTPEWAEIFCVGADFDRLVWLTKRSTSYLYALTCVRRVMIVMYTYDMIDDYLVALVSHMLWRKEHPLLREESISVGMLEILHKNEVGETRWVLYGWADFVPVVQWCRQQGEGKELRVDTSIDSRLNYLKAIKLI